MFYILSLAFLVAGLISHSDFDRLIILCCLSGIFALAASIGSISSAIRDITNSSLRYQIKKYENGISEINFKKDDEKE